MLLRLALDLFFLGCPQESSPSLLDIDSEQIDSDDIEVLGEAPPIINSGMSRYLILSDLVVVEYGSGWFLDRVVERNGLRVRRTGLHEGNKVYSLTE